MSVLKEVDAYISFENGKWRYLEFENMIHLHRFGEFHALASKAEICMFHKILELENSKQIEYDSEMERTR